MEEIQESRDGKSSTTNKENSQKEAPSLNASFEKPNQEDMESKLNKFKAFMFNDAKKLNTSDLFGKIVGIIDKDKQDKKTSNSRILKEEEDILGQQGVPDMKGMSGMLGMMSDLSKSDQIQQMFLENMSQKKVVNVNDVQRIVEQQRSNTNNPPSREVNEIIESEKREDISSNYTTNDDVKTKKYS